VEGGGHLGAALGLGAEVISPPDDADDD